MRSDRLQVVRALVTVFFLPIGLAWGLRQSEETVDTAVLRPPALPKGSPAVSAAQLSAAGQARALGWAVEQDPASGRPVAVRGTFLDGSVAAGAALPPAAGDAALAARSLANVAGIFGIRDAAGEFSLRRTDRDDLGFKHLRLAQQYRGLRVVGGAMTVHCDEAGRAYQVDGTYVPVELADTTPAIKPHEAAAAARGALKVAPADLTALAPALVVWARGGSPTLAYEVELTAAGGRWRAWVDARTGAVLLAYDDRRTVGAPTASGAHVSVSGSILSREGGQSVTVQGWRESNGLHYLYNKNRYWYVFNVAASGYADAATYACRGSASWGTSDRTEMSAARNFDITQQYFSTRHGRASFDNANAYARANVHEGVSYVNAYWDGTDFHFGDGDGITAYPLTVLDVAAHEYTHAVTQYTADLDYYGESGALNESFSDIFGACAEFYAQPDGRSLYPNVQAGYADWLIGEDCWLLSKSLRDMRNPRNTGTVGADGVQPSRYRGTYWYTGSGDNGGVHINSGVQNFFFYLLSEGGSGNNDGIAYSVTGLGVANAERVAYRALTVYCSASTDHIGARVAWRSAAQDLNASWVTSVENAWAAAGVSAGTTGGDAWDPGDDTGSGATSLTPSTTEQLHGPHTLSSSDRYDWFKAYLYAGQTYVFHTQGSQGDNYGELYSDSAGTSMVASNDDGGGDLQFYLAYTPSVTRWYYLRVRAFSVGSSLQYVLKYRQSGGTPPPSNLGAALDAPSLSWTSGGDQPWAGQSATTHDGVDAAQSGAIGHGQTTWFQAVVQGPGSLSFWWRVSSESGFDFQRFQRNGVDVFVRSGEGAWQQKTVTIPSGQQTLRWAYTKDGSVVAGSDRAWVDQVVWAPGNAMTPSGGEVVATRRPAFGWPAVTGATWYHLWIQRNGTAHLTPWVQGSTTWTPPSDLPGGDYRWWVQGWGPAIGYGAWSQPADFSVPYSIPDAIPQIAPAGEQGGYTVTYRWQKDSRATWYQLWVGRVGGAGWHNAWYAMSGTGEGSVSLGGHPAGNFTWWLRGWGPDGFGPWSGPVAFSTPSGVPAVPSLAAPAGVLSASRPVFHWNAAARATWYRVRVLRSSDSRSVLDRWTTDVALTAPSSLPYNSYRWWVGAWNDVSRQTVWSDALDFQTAASGYRYNIAVTWGATPSDLDAHLVTPTGVHVFYAARGSMTAAPYARLEQDDAGGRGPENVTIHQAYTGTYRYYVHNFSGSPVLAGCGARVRVFNAAGAVLFDRTVPASGTGGYWYVFDLNAATGAFTSRNIIQTTPP